MSEPLATTIKAVDHPCHDVCFGDLHADCQCAAWVRQEALAAVAELRAKVEALPTFDDGGAMSRDRKINLGYVDRADVFALIDEEQS